MYKLGTYPSVDRESSVLLPIESDKYSPMTPALSRRELAVVGLLALSGCLGLFQQESDAPSGNVDGSVNSQERPGGRLVRSIGPIELYVNPRSGDDENSGGEDNPLKTFQEALNRLPNFIIHPTTIHLADGDYTEEPYQLESSIHFISFQKNPENSNPFRITGNPDNPENVRLTETGWINFSFRGSVPYRTVIEGIHFDGTVQNYDGAFQIRKCRFSGTKNGNPVYGIDGYNALTILSECWFGDEVETAVYANQGHQIHMTDCEGDVSKIYQTSTFGEVEYSNSNDIDGILPN